MRVMGMSTMTTRFSSGWTLILLNRQGATLARGDDGVGDCRRRYERLIESHTPVVSGRPRAPLGGDPIKRNRFMGFLIVVSTE